MAGIADVVDMWDQLDSCFWLDVVGCRDVHCPIFSPVLLHTYLYFFEIPRDSTTSSRCRESRQNFASIVPRLSSDPIFSINRDSEGAHIPSACRRCSK